MESLILIAEKQYHDQYQNLFPDKPNFRKYPLQAPEDVPREGEADVILLDSGFNIKKGLNVLRKVKAMYTATPIIFITGISSEDTAIEAFRIGVRDYIRKPVNQAELRESIEDMLMIKRLSKEKRKPFFLNKSDEKSADHNADTPELPGNLQEVIRYINENITDEICLGRLARKAYMSKYHFCKKFKRHIGMTPLKYVTAMRIEKAKRLLQNEDIAVSLVAMDAGFHDFSSFTKHFKKHTGLTPATYRSSLMGLENGSVSGLKLQ